MTGNTAFTGGRIYNNLNATLTLKAGSAVTDNEAPIQTFGGGVFNRGTLTRDSGVTM